MAIVTPKDTHTDGSAPAEAVSSRASFAGDQPVNPMAAAPLMAQSVAMMAAATAVGLGVVNQFAGIFLGAMQGALEANKRSVETPDQKELRSANKPAEAAAIPVSALRVVVDNGVAPEQPLAKKSAAEVSAPKPAPKAAKPRGATKAVDDLKRISGIGPKLEKILNDKGLKRFSEVARLSPEQITALDEELGLSGRIARDHWVEQAKALAKERV